MQTKACSCTQTHADASGQMQVKADEPAWTQSELHSVRGWMNLKTYQDVACLFTNFWDTPLQDNTNVYSMVEGDGRSFESFHI